MQQAGQETFLQYYKGIHESANYVTAATRFYETYFMTVTVDSVLRVDSIKKAGMFKNIPGSSNGPMIVEQGTPMIGFAPLASYYAGAFNDGARTIYNYTKKTEYLGKALLWAKRANEFIDQPEIMDTYARLLYKTNHKDVAVTLETKAIEIRKSKKISATEYEKVLDAMQKGLSKIDEY